MNRPARFTEADLRRALKLAEETGRDVEIAPDGTIRLVRKRPEPITAAPAVESYDEIVL